MTIHHLKPEKAIAAAIDTAEEVESFAELANLSPVEYGKRREVLGKQLNINLTFLDQEYRERRKHAKGQKVEQDELFLRDPDPWLEPVNGADLLNALCETAKSHLVLPDDAAEALTLWVLLAHAHDCFDVSPVLGITSPTPECGKTTVLTFLGAVVPRPYQRQTLRPQPCSALWRSGRRLSSLMRPTPSYATTTSFAAF